MRIRSKGGKQLFGWKIGQDKVDGLVQAIFHAVWVSETGDIFDITPRSDLAKRIMFIEDPERKIVLIQNSKAPTIDTYDSVIILRGRVIKPLSPMYIAPQTDMIDKYKLAW